MSCRYAQNHFPATPPRRNFTETHIETHDAQLPADT